MSDPEAPQPLPPAWREVAANPDILEKEQQLAGIRAIKEEVRRSEEEMAHYAWNTGVPYVRSSKRSSTQRTYRLDRPSSDPQAGSPSEDPHYLNDLPIDFESVSPVEGLNVSIGYGTDGQQYLVDSSRRVISPGYPSLTHTGGNTFQAPGYPQPEHLTLLDEQERQEVRERRERLRSLEPIAHTSRNVTRALYEDIAWNVLQSYGVTQENVLRQRMGTTTAFEFTRGDRYVRVEVTGDITRIRTWNANLTAEQRLEAWSAHEARGEKGVQTGMMTTYLDTALPDYLAPYENKIIQGVDDVNAQKREFLQHEAALFEHTGYLEFAVGSRHPSWGIPVAMSIVDLPPSEAFQLVRHPLGGGTPSITVPKPGIFEPHNNKPIAWRLTPEGTIERIKREKDYSVDEQLAAAVRTVEAGRSAATADASDLLTAIIRRIIDTL